MNQDSPKRIRVIDSGELLSKLQDVLRLPGHAQRLNINLEYGSLMVIEYRAVFEEVPFEIAETFRESMEESNAA